MKIQLTKKQQEVLVQVVENTNFVGKEWEFVKELLEALNKETE